MSIDRFRRGVEFDAFHALRTLSRNEDGNFSSYDIGDLASIHFEKFAYICSDVHFGVVEEQLKLLAQVIIEAAKEYAGGETYWMHAESWESEVNARLEQFLDGSRNNTPRLS